MSFTDSNTTNYTNKLDYRLIEIAKISPSKEVRAIVVFRRMADKKILDSYNVRPISDYVSLRIIKVRAKVRDLIELAKKQEISHVLLDE